MSLWERITRTTTSFYRRITSDLFERRRPPRRQLAKGSGGAIESPYSLDESKRSESHTELVSRPFTEWDPENLKTAKLQADLGILRMLSDLIECVTGDDRVGGALQQRCRGLLGLQVSFSQDKDRRKKNRVEQSIEEDWPEIINHGELERILRWGLMLGVCPVEAVWVEGKSGRMIPKLKAWNPRNLQWHPLEKRWSIMTWDAGRVYLDSEPGKWFLFMPFAENRPWIEGCWWRVARWWLMKFFAMSDWARFNEAHAQPTWLLETPENYDREKRRELAEDFQNLSRDKAIAMPQGIKAKLEEANSDTWTSFEKQIQVGNQAMTISLLGQDGTMEKDATHASSTTLNGVRRDLLTADGVVLGWFFQKGPLSVWAEVNHGSSRLAPLLEWDTTPPEDLEAKAKTQNLAASTLKMLKEIGAHKLIKLRSYLEEFGFPVTDEAGDELPEPDSSPTPTTPAPDGNAPPDAKPPGAQASRARPKVFMADSENTSQAMIDGHLYTDEVAEAGRKRMLAQMPDMLEIVLGAIERAGDFDEARANLLQVFPELSTREIRQLITAGAYMAEAAGRYSVDREA